MNITVFQPLNIIYISWTCPFVMDLRIYCPRSWWYVNTMELELKTGFSTRRQIQFCYRGTSCVSVWQRSLWNFMNVCENIHLQSPLIVQPNCLFGEPIRLLMHTFSVPNFIQEVASMYICCLCFVDADNKIRLSYYKP